MLEQVVDQAPLAWARSRGEARGAGAPASGGASRMPAAPSLGRRMVALVLGLAGALAALAALGVWQAQEAARRQAAEQLLGTTRAMARLVDLELARVEGALNGLGLSPALRAGDLGAFLPEAQAAAVDLDLPLLAVLGPDGRPLGAGGSAEDRREGAGASQARPEAVRAFETGRAEIGDAVLGAAAGRRRGIPLAVPVRGEGRGGEIRYALGAVLPRERLTASLVGQRLPQGWAAVVLDRTHAVAARAGPEEDRASGLPAAPLVREGLATRDEGLILGADAPPRSMLAYARVPRSGYAVVVAAPDEGGLLAGARSPVLVGLAALGVAIAAAALLLALALRRSLSDALRGLAAPGGGPVAGVPRLREVEELAAALAVERAARDRAETALRERGEWSDAAQQAAQVGVWQRDAAAGRTRWSAGMRRILDLPPGPEVLPPGASWLDGVHPDDRARVAASAEARLAPGAGTRFSEEFRVLTAAGEERWVRSQGVVERDAAGRSRRVLGAWIDVTARRALEAERDALTRQRDLQAGEIHHRVRNSLQLVLGLLLMQARRVAPEAAAPLRDAASRIATIASVHRRLYEAAPETAGDLGAYLADLARDMHASVGGDQAGGVGARPLRLALESGIRVPADRLPTIGIVAAELITNAVKYGAGAVTLRLSRAGEWLEIAVEDQGRGFPGGFDPAASRGLGMRVATTLARQLGGQILVDRGAAGGRVVLQASMDASASAGPPARRTGPIA